MDGKIDHDELNGGCIGRDECCTMPENKENYDGNYESTAKNEAQPDISEGFHKDSGKHPSRNKDYLALMQKKRWPDLAEVLNS